jgi:hypothetical protein
MLFVNNLTPYGGSVKNIIYSIYIENNDNNLNPIHYHTKTQLAKHYQRLIDIKKDYATICNAEFKLYENDIEWQEFKSKYNSYQFDVINLYKIYLWEKLANTYDNVLYLDFDVIPNTSESFFDKFDMNYICVHSPNATKENVWSKSMLKNRNNNKHTFEYLLKNKGKYNMYIKALAKKSMLALDNNFNTNYFIANTAIIGGNSNAIKQLKFTENLNHMIDLLNTAKKESLFGEEVSKLFFTNNEVFFQYLIDKNNLKWINIPYEWHTYIIDADGKICNNEITEDVVKNSKMIHLINKKFDELWKVLK